jgi:hypothetical protein
MFGDAFGGSALKLTFFAGQQLVRTESYPFTAFATPALRTGSAAAQARAADAKLARDTVTDFVFTNQVGTTLLQPTFGNVMILGQTLQQPIFLASPSPSGFGAPPGTSLPLAESSEITAIVQQLRALRGETARFNPTSSYLVQFNDSEGLTQGSGTAIYDFYRNFFATILVPSPSGGGVVGRTKIADDNSPIPRDRIIFNYDYFNHAVLTSHGADVNRISVGFEKTFLNQSSSIEVRLPFAGTIDSTVITEGQTARQTELGDLHITLKTLAYTSDTINVAVGCGFSLPTANDINVNLADGTRLLRARNDAFLIEPYAAALFTPNDRLFTQVWAQLTFNANGNRIDADMTGRGLTEVGHLYDHSMLLTSAQVGYWLYRSNSTRATITGFAPFVELNYNATLGGGNAVQAGLFQLDGRQNLNELNASFGFSALVRDNFQLMVGASVPVLSGENHRTFDYQIGIRGNLFFGATAASRRAASASTF